jgi:alkanesulfonate monooxygenase SsuD/methylene tetrahydromethanopterin reductase-like flavin-dependent oxidoreductase (luciferase family)
MGSFPLIGNIYSIRCKHLLLWLQTEKIALGTSVIDILFHNPVILARRFATLDVLSGGRAIAGCGIGW